MTKPKLDPTDHSPSDVAAWLRMPMSVTLPRWALIAAAATATVLLLVALD
jgi:hypothetical protein